jgi:hypothetical protein
VSAPPDPPPARSAIRVAFETAVSTFIYSFISAIIATGAPYPPTLPSLYGPGLVSLLLGIGVYMGARHIALPAKVVP